MPAPKVTPEDVSAAIKGATYTVLPNGRTTVCQLTLDNDFTVEGYSACVSLENFDAALGRELALKDATTKIWPLLGFRLADQLAGISDPPDVIDAPPASRLPITAFRNGVFQTAESVKYYGPDAWFMVNLQLYSDFPYAMSEVEEARVYCNTHCNADGTLAGSTTPPLRFPQADSVTEIAALQRCNATPFVKDVKKRMLIGYQLDYAKSLAPVIGVKLGETRPNLYALRAQTWADVTEWFARA